MIAHEQVRKFLSNFDYWLNEQTAEMVQKYLSDYIAQQKAQSKRLAKVEDLLKQYQVLAHDYEVLSNNKDRTKLGLLIFAVEEGKRVIKQLEEELE